jgi:hypothetical protein
MSIAGCLPLYGFAPLIVATSMIGGSQPLYEGVYTVEEYSQGVYFSTWMAT